MDLIDTWIIILGLINLFLLIIFLLFILPKDNKKFEFVKIIKKHFLYIMIIFFVVGFHLFEVNIIDQKVTDFVNHDFAGDIKNIEGDAVYWFSQHWNIGLVYFFVIIYIGIYSFTLWFSPLFFLLTDNKKAMKTLAYGLFLVYSIALPFYLFLPVTNVYKFYGIGSALESAIPGIENFFYSTTTQNNCLPSLHTAMTLLIAYSVSLTGNKKYTYFAYFVAITVIISILYLSIHWIIDVITGAALSAGVILILKKYIKE